MELREGRGKNTETHALLSLFKPYGANTQPPVVSAVQHLRQKKPAAATPTKMLLVSVQRTVWLKKDRGRFQSHD